MTRHVSPAFWPLAHLGVVASSVLAAQTSTGKRPVTVPDMIRMTRFAEVSGGGGAPIFSHDSTRFIVVIRRGDLERNTVISTALMYRVTEAFSSPRPDTLVTLTSSSNNPAIADVRWLPGDTSVIFLGERAGDRTRVYALDVQTRSVTTVAAHATSIERYFLAPDGNRLLYAAPPPRDAKRDEYRRSHGFVVGGLTVRDVLFDDWDKDGEPQDLMLVRLADGRKTRITGGGVNGCSGARAFSPDSRFLVMQCVKRVVPDEWRDYGHHMIRGWVAVPVSVIVDLDRAKGEVLLDAPMHGKVSWAPDGSAVVLTDVYLPLAGVDSAEREARLSQTMTVAIDPLTRRPAILSRREGLAVARWDSATRTVVLRSTGDSDRTEIAFRKQSDAWVAVAPSRVSERTGAASDAPANTPRIFVEEGLNAPPRLVAVDASTGRRAVLLDPNPQFASLAFGKESVFTWQTADGEWKAGLYYPVGYVPGKRYPLVIQTHGFDSTKFAIEGVFTTGNAAQAFAGRGIVVLQMAIAPPRDREHWEQTDEAPREMRAMESVIDSLDERGLIDRDRVGLIGFSRTCYYVKYMITHSSYSIAATAITDGVDYGYVRYIIESDIGKIDVEGMNGGGPPAGDFFDTWREIAPGFRVELVKQPMRIESIAPPGGGSPLTQWEFYTMMRRYQKPVELIHYPRADHIMVKPWERLSSQGGNFDWFRFWLLGQQDPDPAKAGQYERWRAMRKQLADTMK